MVLLPEIGIITLDLPASVLVGNSPKRTHLQTRAINVAPSSLTDLPAAVVPCYGHAASDAAYLLKYNRHSPYSGDD